METFRFDAVMPDLIRHPRHVWVRAAWIASQARNDKSGDKNV
jgi:hypothetical protein